MRDLTEVKAQVKIAFEGFIGNEEAVHTVSRSLAYALANAPEDEKPKMDKVLLLIGPPSCGKTDISKRITKVLGVPHVRLDGRGLRSRERLFELIDDMLLGQKPPVQSTRNGDQSGIPIYEYPPFAIFIDEIHLAPERTQESLLTLLEADDRSLLLDGERRRVASVKWTTFIFATTKPADLDRAFRSRCIEVQLRSYSTEEVQEMVRRRFTMLPPNAIETIAACSRNLPRVAFAMAQEVVEEVLLSDDGDIRACVRRVMYGRGVRYPNGLTVDDHRYLDMLKREQRPIGERAVQAQLYDIDPLRITDDIEPLLIGLGLISVTSKGRQITVRGANFLRDAKQISVR